MKLVFMMYLEDDDGVVRSLLDRLRIPMFSQIQLEGHGSGAGGWYGEVAPYRSRMAFAALPEAQARDLLDAVRHLEGGLDPRHPVRAFQVSIEESVTQIVSPKAEEQT